jgi:hypothetical protein
VRAKRASRASIQVQWAMAMTISNVGPSDRPEVSTLIASWIRGTAARFPLEAESKSVATRDCIGSWEERWTGVAGS